MEITETRQMEMLVEVREIAETIIGCMGFSDVLKTCILTDDYSDPELHIGNRSCSVIATVLRVEDNSIGSLGRKIDAEGFVIGHGVVIPGVRYYKDGSGEPDDYDFVEVEDTQVAVDAAVKGIRHALNLLLDNGTEVYGENKMFEQMEKDRKEAEEEMERIEGT